MDFSTFLILDCKTTIWESQAEQPAGQISELIGLDVALVDTTKNCISEQDSFLIKPKKSKVGAYCEKLFGLKQSALDAKGDSFQDIYRKLRIHYMSKDRLWGSWGAYEKFTIEKQCKNLKLESLFYYPHYDIQDMYTLMIGADNDSRPISISSALKTAGLLPSPNEAVNVANIFMRMSKGLRQHPYVKTRVIVNTPVAN